MYVHVVENVLIETRSSQSTDSYFSIENLETFPPRVLVACLLGLLLFRRILIIGWVGQHP